MKQGLKIVPPPSVPMAVARALAKSFFSTATGVFTLRVHRGHFYQWNGGTGPRWIRMMFGRSLSTTGARSLRTSRKRNATVRAVTGKGQQRDGCAARNRRARHQRGGALLDRCGERRPAPRERDRVDGKRAPSYPDSHPKTPHPSIFSATTRSSLRTFPMLILRRGGSRFWVSCGDMTNRPSNALHEMMGYLLGGGTRLQKMFLLVGPKRAGKGTIGAGPHRPTRRP